VSLEEASRRFDLKKWLKGQRFTTTAYSKEWLSDCPFCGATDKFSVNPKTRKWRCFVCHIPCSLIDVITAYEGTRQRATQVIYDGMGHRAGGLQFIPAFVDDEDDVYHRRPGWEPAPVYPPSHFVPLVEHHPYTRARGMDLDFLRAAGVGICTWGRYQDRLIFPVRRYPDGAWIYFQGRAMWEKHEHTPAPYTRANGTINEDKYQKNRNPFSDDTGKLANANDVLLGLDLVVAHRIQRVALVEGPTDWIAVGPGAVASFGKSLSLYQLQLLVRAGIKEIDLMWDPDAWEAPTRKLPDGRVMMTGHASPAQAVAAQLSTFFTVRVVHFHKGTDPGDYNATDNQLWRESARSYGEGRLSYIP
jgi:hypothetical protein